METQEVINEGEFSQARLDSSESGRPKSSLRMRYMAEVKLLKQELGGLNEVRERLGLSRRKMCQLLLVDPSAWTRWSRDESKVPPHIWKMLWMMTANEHDPKERLEMEKLSSKLNKFEKTLKIQRLSLCVLFIIVAFLLLL